MGGGIAKEKQNLTFLHQKWQDNGVYTKNCEEIEDEIEENKATEPQTSMDENATKMHVHIGQETVGPPVILMGLVEQWRKRQDLHQLLLGGGTDPSMPTPAWPVGQSAVVQNKSPSPP